MPEGSNTITLASRDSQGNCNVLQWTLPRGGHDLPLYSVWVVGTWSIRFCSCCSLLLLAPSASTFIYVKLFSYFCMKLFNSANMQEKREPHETYTCVHDHILFVILTFFVFTTTTTYAARIRIRVSVSGRYGYGNTLFSQKIRYADMFQYFFIK